MKNDSTYGDAGNDTLDDAPRGGASGVDHFYGGAGNDVLAAGDGTHDFVDCGPGYDVAQVDHLDSVSRCEKVIRIG